MVFSKGCLKPDLCGMFTIFAQESHNHCQSQILRSSDALDRSPTTFHAAAMIVNVTGMPSHTEGRSSCTIRRSVRSSQQFSRRSSDLQIEKGRGARAIDQRSGGADDNAYSSPYSPRRQSDTQAGTNNLMCNACLTWCLIRKDRVSRMRHCVAHSPLQYASVLVCR